MPTTKTGLILGPLFNPKASMRYSSRAEAGLCEMIEPGMECAGRGRTVEDKRAVTGVCRKKLDCSRDKHGLGLIIVCDKGISM